jgi:hypothetical protein
MKKSLSFTKLTLMTMIAIAIGALMYACQDPAADLATPSNALSKPTVDFGTGATECDVTLITTNTTLSNANNYLLKGDVRVVSGVTLTIDPGTVIFGDKASRGTLSIEMGGRINAVGNKNQPIIFTSSAAPGERRPNDWGGINIFGQSLNNLGTNLLPEGYPACVTPPRHGGNICDDNSGRLSYVRIEYGGIPLADVINFPNSEKNALTLYSVGSGTQIDHIQVSYGGDDGFEFFGGSVSASYLFSLGMVDDDFDTDNGYGANLAANDEGESGCGPTCVQYGVALRHPLIADISQSNGFESDNNAAGNPTLPRTGALFSNFTLIGPYDPSGVRTVINNPSPGKRFGDGMHLRRSTGLDVENSLILGWHLRQSFVAAGVTEVDLSCNTAVVPFSVATASCFAEPAGGPWATDASNICLAATAHGDEFTTGSLAELSGMPSSAWPAVLQIDSDPGEEYWEFDTFFADDLRPLSGAAITMNGCLRDCVAPNTTTEESETYFRGAFREQFTADGWDTDGIWLEMNPQFVPHP